MHFRKGVSALASIVALGAIIILVTSTTIWVENSRTTNYVSDTNSAQAMAAAESGLQDALLKLNLKTTSANYNVAINGITVGVCYYPDTPQTSLYTIRAVAAKGGATRSFKAIANKDATTSSFEIVSKEEEVDSPCTVTEETAPSAPLNLVWVSSANGQITINWSYPFSDGYSNITNYKIYRGVTTGGEELSATIGNTLTYTDTGLTNNANYYYKVSAVNAIGPGPLSGEVLTIPGQAPIGGTVIVSNYASGNYVGTTYQISTDFTSFNTVNSCDYTTNNGANWSSATLSGTLLNYNCLKTGVMAQDTVSYGINMRMTSNVGVSPATAITKTGDTVTPTNPSLTATPSDTQVSLSWPASSDTGSGLHPTAPYKLVYATGATAPVNCNTGTVIYSNTATSYTHQGLNNGTPYSYRVCAIDAVLNMSTGTTASATPVPACSCGGWSACGSCSYGSTCATSGTGTQTRTCTPSGCSTESQACTCTRASTDGVTCRASAGVCDTAETCSGGVCPADAKVANGTVCTGWGTCGVTSWSGSTCNTGGCPISQWYQTAAGSQSSSTCASGACTGTTSQGCTPSPSTQCTTATCAAWGACGSCSYANVCTLSGTGTQTRTCTGTGCGPTSQSCTCTRASTNGVSCRASAGVCDTAETCSGGVCPADAKVANGTVCTGWGTCSGSYTGGTCDTTCDGSQSASTCSAGVCTGTTSQGCSCGTRGTDGTVCSIGSCTDCGTQPYYVCSTGSCLLGYYATCPCSTTTTLPTCHNVAYTWPAGWAGSAVCPSIGLACGGCFSSQGNPYGCSTTTVGSPSGDYCYCIVC